MSISARSARDVIADLKYRYEARTPLIALLTTERERALGLLKQVIEDPYHEQRKRSLYVWSCRKGVRRVAGPDLKLSDEPVCDIVDPKGLVLWLETYCDRIKDGSEQGGIFVLHDFGQFLTEYGAEDVKLTTGLRDVAALAKARGVSLVFLGATFPDIPSLERDVLRLTLPLPVEDDARRILQRRVLELERHPLADTLDIELTTERADRIVPLLMGLTEEQMERVVLYGIKRTRTLGQPFLDTLIDEKKGIVNQSGALSWYPPQALATVGGYAGLLEFLAVCARTFAPAARAYGVRPKKGLAFLGLPGTGKDHIVKAMPGIFNMPLYMLDASFMGAGDSRLGAAEAEVKSMLAQVEAQQSILGISEFEKVFGGVGSGYTGDGGASNRVGSLLLNWQSDQTSCFVVATMNDISHLQPEQLRSGRFDHLLFFDYPDVDTRRAVAEVHLVAQKQEPGDLDMGRVAEMTEDFSCAEIATAINQAVINAFVDGAARVGMAEVERAVRLQAHTLIARTKPAMIADTRARAKAAGCIDVNDLGTAVSIEDLVSDAIGVGVGIDL